MTTTASQFDMEYAENIVNTVREPLLVLDSSLHIISANAAFYSTFKVTPTETIGNFIYDLGNRQWNIPALRVLLENILPQNTLFNDYEVDHFFQNIGRKIILLNARQIFRKEIGSHIILLAMEDITKRSQEKLELNERIKELRCLYSILDKSSEAGISRDKLFMDVVMLIPPAFQFPEITEASIEIDGQFFQTARFLETPWRLTSDITVNDSVVGQVKVCYLQNRQASDTGSFVIQERQLLDAIAMRLGRHIERNNIMEQLIHSQKIESIGELAGGLAHDLNNILSVINGYATLAQLGMDSEQKGFHYLEEVNRASSRAATLTRSLLAYSRKQEMKLLSQDLNPLIETVGSFIKRIIRDNIEFTLSLQSDPLVVYVDTVQIEQVLLNLATNARDAMPDGGRFSIATTAESLDERFIATHGYGTVGRYAITTVTDSGCGMNEQTKRKVFDPFFTTKEANKGTGLGLSMVQGIIKQHGGFIDLQSEPGRGSVFKLYLPLVDTLGEVSNAEPAEQQRIQTGKDFGTILVAEDDADTRDALAEFLARAGYTVITAIDGQDAVDKFAARTGKIDLVISDVVMPNKSGKAASEEIRQMDKIVKFIFVSGHADDVIWREGGFGPNVEIMAKPILPFELLQKIMAVM